MYLTALETTFFSKECLGWQGDFMAYRVQRCCDSTEMVCKPPSPFFIFLFLLQPWITADEVVEATQTAIAANTGPRREACHHPNRLPATHQGGETMPTTALQDCIDVIKLPAYLQDCMVLQCSRDSLSLAEPSSQRVCKFGQT